MSEESLEELAKKLSRSINLSKPVTMMSFEHRTLKIIRKYTPDAYYEPERGHSRKRAVKFIDKDGHKRKISICKKQKGKEKFISIGLFKCAVAELSLYCGIPAKYIELYVKGDGHSFKKYTKKLEEEYEI